MPFVGAGWFNHRDSHVAALEKVKHVNSPPAFGSDNHRRDGRSTHGATTQTSINQVAPPDATVAHWIAQLSGEEWSARQEATDQLVRWGEDARPALEAVIRDSKDVEGRTRAESALRQIDENRIIGPTYVTLHYKDTSAEQVFADLGKQARVHWEPDDVTMWKDGRLPLVSIDVQRQPLCAVLADLCRKTHLMVKPSSDPDKACLALDEEDSFDRPSSAHGPFLVVADEIHVDKGMTLKSARPVTTEFTLQCTVLREPKLRILSCSSSLEVEEAIDEKGNSLVQPTQADEVAAMDKPQPGQPLTLIASLLYPPNAGKQIARFKGSATFVVQTRGELIEMTNVMKPSGAGHKAAGAVFTLKKMQKTSGGYEAIMAVQRNLLPDAEWERLGTIVEGALAQLLDARGNAYVPRGSNPGNSSNDVIEVKLQFASEGVDSLGEPSKLVLEVPVETKDLKVPFEFKDLPIP